MTSVNLDITIQSTARQHQSPFAVFRRLECLVALACIVIGPGMAAAQTPAVGAKAADFTLQTPTGTR